MVPLLAAQSVQTKCRMNKSVMTGNYEFYYACGLYLGMRNMSDKADRSMSPAELFDIVSPLAKEDKTENREEKYLCQMIYEYRIEETVDDQTGELFDMGLNDAATAFK